MGGLPVLPMFAVAGLALISIAYCAGLSRWDSFSSLPRKYVIGRSSINWKDENRKKFTIYSFITGIK
jgi:hypothetical protein